VRNADKSALINSEAFQRCLESLISRAYLPQPLSVNLIQRLTLLTNLVARQADDSDLLRQTQLRVIATDLLVALATADIVTRDSSNAVIDRTLAYLAERLDQKIRMDDLLNYVGYGQSQFFRLFRQQTGLTPTAWITRCRIRRACELLRNTSEPVRQIAAQVGCPDASYFCRLFKHHIGKTPLDYRTARSGGLGV